MSCSILQAFKTFVMREKHIHYCKMLRDRSGSGIDRVEAGRGHFHIFLQLFLCGTLFERLLPFTAIQANAKTIFDAIIFVHGIHDADEIFSFHGVLGIFQSGRASMATEALAYLFRTKAILCCNYHSNIIAQF